MGRHGQSIRGRGPGLDRAHAAGLLWCAVLAVMPLTGQSLAQTTAEVRPMLLNNGGFEKLAKAPGVPDTGGQRWTWTIKGGPWVPAGWEFSTYFGAATLTVIREGASEGKCALRVQAGAKREAHIRQQCPGVWAGGSYRTSLRYRGGPVAIKAYEYVAGKPNPRIVTLAESRVPADDWQSLDAAYLPRDLAHVRMIASVAAGATADLDDFRVWWCEREIPPDPPGWLNVNNYGVSGSEFETTGETSADSSRITVASPGDFRTGQDVTISKCHPHYENQRLRGPAYGPWRKLGDALEIRGYDGTAGSWLVYSLEIDGNAPLTFWWDDDIRNDVKQRNVPVTWDWQPLSHGIEVRFRRDFHWEPGHVITFTARDHLATRIEAIEGKTLVLSHPATRAVADAVVRHDDTRALQAVIDRAVRERKHVLLPAGRYRLREGLKVRNPESIRIEGAGSVQTVLDISEGEGAILGLHGGTEVIVRNLSMIGHTGLADKPRDLKTVKGWTLWRCGLKTCKASHIRGTERVLFENVHASKMAAECYYAHGPDRDKRREEKSAYTKSLTFLRCSVKDCAANAFNNNDNGENTHILYCRIEDVGWYAYEGPARFVKIVGNYMRNSGPFRVGNQSGHKKDHLHELGCGQAIIRDNVIEGTNRSSGISLGHGPTQVTVVNNLFVNFNGPSAILAQAGTHHGYPARNITISGNVIDLTAVDGPGKRRIGIHVGAPDMIVSDNQIYVRGEPDTRVTGIRLEETAVNVSVHDNLIRNCRYGISTGRASSTVTEVVDARTLLEAVLPTPWRYSHGYRGWSLAWLTGKSAGTVATIDHRDPDTWRFLLRSPHPDMKPGDRFEVFSPAANWRIHDNTISGCLAPVVLSCHGSPTSTFADNLLERGRASGVKAAVTVAGRFNVIGNHIVGFDEPDCAALSLKPDPVGRSPRNTIRGNCVVRCSVAVREEREGLWDAAIRDGNVFHDCVAAPAAAQTRKSEVVPAAVVAAPGPAAARQYVLRAMPGPDVKVDGDLSEWPWQDGTRVIRIEQDLNGDVLGTPKGRACATWDTEALCLGLHFAVAGGKGEAYTVEVSLRNADPAHRTPVFIFVGKPDGTLKCLSREGGAERLAGLAQATTFAARQTAKAWTCELRVPFAAMGMHAATAQRLRFNIGMHSQTEGTWLTWVLTGGRICEVDNAGELHLMRGK